MNAPTSTTGALIIKDSGGLNSSLIIESSKGAYISQFGSGLGGNIDLRSALVSSVVSIQDMGGIVLIGTNTQYTSFQTTIGGNTCLVGYAQVNNDLNVLGSLFVKGSATIDLNLLVKGVTLSSSDERIKTDVQPINQDLCVEIIKSVEPKSYKRTDKINNEKRECGFIAQDLLTLLSPDMQNRVQEVQDDTYEQTYAVDYGRLTTILWGVCKNLIKRIEILEKTYI